MLFIWHKGAHIGLPFHLQFENLSSQEHFIIIHLPGMLELNTLSPVSEVLG